jgi:hypothetical protein
VLLSRYDALLRSRALQPDAGQAALVARLAALLDALQAYSGAMAAHKAGARAYKVCGWCLVGLSVCLSVCVLCE